jgi:NAD(P)-dependent dehydrogenase (short-subunit alcohol dehydrogenase family)
MNGSPLTVISADIADRGDLDRMAAGAETLLRPVHMLVNCAGASRPVLPAISIFHELIEGMRQLIAQSGWA